MEPEDLELLAQNGNNAFCFAAVAGSIEIAKMMLAKNANLLTLRGAKNMVPLYMAILFERREMAKFFYDESKSDFSYLTLQDGADLFFESINTDLYFITLQLLEDQPDLAVTRDVHNDTDLHVLARKPSSMFAHSRIGILKSLTCSKMKFTHNRELVSTQALELVKCLDRAIQAQRVDIETLIASPSNLLFDATKSRNFEFLAELVRSYPALVHQLNEQERSIFHIAILYRQTNIFNLIYEIGFDKELIASYEDVEKNNMLHLAAKYLDPPPVSSLSGAGLEMQQELLMFERVTLEHKRLLYSAERWMKTTSMSRIIVATLIVTVVFSAAFTVRGGNNDKTGIPFRVFDISAAIALSSSLISILMFLSILTSGYTEMEFKRSLPLKLMVGLSALFISIVSMMITVSWTFFLDYHDMSNLIFIVALIYVSLPINLLVLLQYPLLRDLLYITCRFRFPPK
ncbi:hypothetical protein ACOSQ2_007813 [Xanthoceras sorbifolium]